MRTQIYKNMNHLSEIICSPYEIFGLRHGPSKPQQMIPLDHGDHPGIIVSNQPGIIISHPDLGTQLRYGLAEKGAEEVAGSVRQAKETGILDKDTLIVSSDFSRTMQSAMIAQEILNTRTPIFTVLLRERNFGELDGTSSQNYPLVWSEDEKNPDHRLFGVESVNQVLCRTTSLIRGILDVQLVEQKKILLVSHGDSLQILETGFRKTDPGRHRHLKPLQTSEIRRYDDLMKQGS